MHKNSRFNIVQAVGNCNPNFVVIDGQRTDSGQMAHGAKIVSDEMPRTQAIERADKMQAEADRKAADKEFWDKVKELGGWKDGDKIRFSTVHGKEQFEKWEAARNQAIRK
jgi:hypothetical protein